MRPCSPLIFVASCLSLSGVGVACDPVVAGSDDPRIGIISINEFMASNSSVCVDDAGEADDWLELFNSGDDDVDLDGLHITDDRATPQKASLDGLSVGAGEVLLLWADGTPAQGQDHLPFKLSAAGEELVVFAQDAIVDELSWTAAVTDVSSARLPDGGGDISTCAAATCGERNGASCDEGR